VRTHLSRRVLAGATSLAIGGVFVAASAMAALADSPSPTTITANVTTNPGNNTVTVSVSGTLQWKNGGQCQTNKGAGFAVVWGDKHNPGNALPGTTGVGTTLANSFGEAADNAVHTTNCSGTSTSFGPLAHTYASSQDLPSQVCAVGYHYDNKTASGSHSRIAGGVGLNTDNSVQEPNTGLPSVVCVNVVPPAKPDVAVSKTGPTTAKVGDDITYTITVRNAGTVPTDQGITLTDSVPTSLQFKSVSAPAGSGWTCTQAASFTCTMPGPLAVGASAAPITVVGTALDAAVPQVTNTAVVGTPDDSDSSNNTSSWTTTVARVVTPQPDVTIQKDATPSVVVGGAITYTITVSNDSKQDTDKTLTVTDNVPVTVQVTSVVPGNGWSCTGTQNISCTYSKSLAGGATAPVIKVIGTALAGAAPSVTNIADVTNPNDTNPNNNEDKATTVVDTTAPVLSLVKSSDPASGSTVKRGQQIDYTLTYSNTGDGDAGLTVITDGIPANTTYVPGSAACGAAGCNASYDVGDNDVDWSLNLPAHATGSVTFSVTVNNDAPDNTVIDNVATINNDGHKIPSNHVRHLVFVPSGDIALVKSVDPKTAKAGTVLNYTLVATASGNITQHNVVVTDEVPDGTTYTSADCASPCTASFDSSTGIATWQLGDMSPGDSQSLAFTVTVNGPVNGTLPASIPNVGHVKSNETPKTPSNRVVVPVTQVLGTKITRTVPPATTLPFTGIPVLQDILLAMVLVGAGVTLLTWPRIQPQRRTV
jgi:uncharacterized repeat protein (TIGR01451 family)